MSEINFKLKNIERDVIDIISSKGIDKKKTLVF
jgi:hypothetical protein